MKNMIETKNLTKTYKEFIAVDHVSLHIKKGSIYGRTKWGWEIYDYENAFGFDCTYWWRISNW